MEERLHVLTTIARLDRWVSVEEIAKSTAYPIETVSATTRSLHLQRQISSFKDYFGRRRFARVPELVGKPLLGRGVYN